MTALARLSDDQARALVTELSKKPVALIRGDLEPFLPRDVPNLTSEAAEDIVVAVLGAGTEVAESGVPPEDFAADVAASTSLVLESAERQVLRKRLVELLATPSVITTAKALGLQGEFERVFHMARVVTDLRPLFTGSKIQPPQMMLLTHSLKIEFHDDRGADAVYIALDDIDLDELDGVVQRAKEKADALRSLAAKAGITLLEAKNGNHHRLLENSSHAS